MYLLRLFFALGILMIPTTSETNTKNQFFKQSPSMYYQGDWQTLHIKGKNLEVPNTKIYFKLLGLDSLYNFAMPCENIKIISPYGKRDGKMHTGTDIKQKKNAPIFAVFDGKVRMASNYGGYGNTIVIRHPNGLESVYGHLEKILVNLNQEVCSGDTIALAGRTGRASTDHLHFELRYLYNHFDSEIVFDFENKTLKSHEFIYKKGNFKAKKSDSTYHP